jgi:hypothetical protein
VSLLTTDIERPSILFASPGEKSTLDDLIVGVWEDLSSRLTASCPLCGGDVRPRFGAGPKPVGGRCSDCATEIS